MKRKKLIPLLLFLLLLLLILCVWCHSKDIVKNRAINSSTVKQDIDFNFVKKDNNLELTGNFASEKSVQVLHTGIGNTQFKNLSNINKELSPKEGVVSLSQKLLLSFNEHYKNGSISYANGTLTVEGVVEDKAHKNAISALLSSSSIDSQNNTRVVIPGPTAEELAAIKNKREAQERTEAQNKARQEAEQRAKVKAEEARLAVMSRVQEQARLASIAEEKAKKLQAEKLEAVEQAKFLEEKIKKILTFENINFELNKATLTEESINTVSHIAAILKENPNVHVEIAGHSDNLGDDTYNLKLSQKRVDTVKEQLIGMEISANRLTAIGYGETNPLVSNDTEENRRINRRVEFKVLGE